jgi:hypothetical protein
MEVKVVQVRGALSDGDPITVVDLDGVLVLSPKVGLVPKLAAEIERLRTRAGLSLDDLLEAQAQERASP